MSDWTAFVTTHITTRLTPTSRHTHHRMALAAVVTSLVLFGIAAATARRNAPVEKPMEPIIIITATATAAPAPTAEPPTPEALPVVVPPTPEPAVIIQYVPVEVPAEQAQPAIEVNAAHRHVGERPSLNAGPP